MNGNGRVRLGQVPLAPYSGLVRQPFLSGGKYRMGDTAALTDANFSQALSAPKAIVDLWSPSCPYCVEYKPTYEDVASNPPQGVQMFTADINQAPKAAATFGLKSLPTTIFLVNGKEVHREEGGMPKEELVAAVGTAFRGGTPPAPGTPGAPQVISSPPVMVSGSGSTSPWLVLGGLGAAGLMGWLILKQ
jgi:thiol-disulfide isomerase/thioredoxin